MIGDEQRLDFIDENPWSHSIWIHAAEIHPELHTSVTGARHSLASLSYGTAWDDMDTPQRYTAIGWAGFVEAAITEWITNGHRGRDTILTPLLQTAKQLGVNGL